MRLLLATALIALLGAPAYAQQGASVNMPTEANVPRSLPPDPRVKQYRKEVDQEFQAATQKIPEQKKKNNDPWADVRSADPAPKPKR
jgi:hypothetical protein